MPPAGRLPGRDPLLRAGMDRRQPAGATEAHPDRLVREPAPEAAIHKEEEQQPRDPGALMRRARASAAEKARIRKLHLTAKTLIGREV
ncbi:MAG TPA: hypothetical protein DHV79_03405, partial [Lachnospiraceae bacterium]|nr:hypothetical protein [Lachnospiraceae bacterium]